MKKSLLVLLIGVAIIIAGFVLLVSLSSLVEKQFPTTAVLASGQLLGPGQMHSVVTNIDLDQEFFLGVSGMPRDVPLIAKAIDSNSEDIVEVAFHGNLFQSIDRVSPGEYTFTIFNVGDKQATIFVILTPDPLLDDFEKYLPITYLAATSSALIIIGVVVVIAGGVIWIFQKRNKTTKNKK